MLLLHHFLHLQPFQLVTWHFFSPLPIEVQSLQPEVKDISSQVFWSLAKTQVQQHSEAKFSLFCLLHLYIPHICSPSSVHYLTESPKTDLPEKDI